VLRRVADWLRGLIERYTGRGQATGSGAVALIQANAYKERILKRERPRVTSTWRMCPSC
jgi:hypothetical protein